LTVGNNASIGTNLIIGGNASVGANLTIGNNVVLGGNASIGANLTIGNNVYIGNNAHVANVISSGALVANSVTTTSITPGAVTSSSIGTGAVIATSIAASAVTSAAIASGSLLSNMFTSGCIPASALSASSSTQIGSVVGSGDYAVSDPSELEYFDFGGSLYIPANIGDTVYITVYAVPILVFDDVLDFVTEWQINFKLIGTNPDSTLNDEFVASTFTMNWATYSEALQTNFQIVTGSFTATQTGTMTFSSQFSWTRIQGDQDPSSMFIDPMAAPATMTGIYAPKVG
jgi:hypothetical protein